jgi:hypothetical protein
MSGSIFKLSGTGKRLAFISFGVLLILACNAIGGIGETGKITPSADLPGIAPTETPVPLPQGVEETEPVTSPQPGACPQGRASYGLQANHHFWTSTGMGDWVWQAAGSLQFILDEHGRVTNKAAQTIAGSQSGEFSSGNNRCSFEAPAMVNITVDGACTQGRLSLEIWEDWQMGTYQWVCDDDSFQFDLPSPMMPPSIHKVDYVLGNVDSYTFEIPFGGGSGTKVYTLVPGS